MCERGEVTSGALEESFPAGGTAPTRYKYKTFTQQAGKEKHSAGQCELELRRNAWLAADPCLPVHQLKKTNIHKSIRVGLQLTIVVIRASGTGAHHGRGAARFGGQEMVLVGVRGSGVRLNTDCSENDGGGGGGTIALARVTGVTTTGASIRG